MANKRITDVDYIELLNSDESFFVNQNNAIKQINKKNIIAGIGAVSISNAKVELLPSGWVNNEQIVNVDNVTEKNTVIVSPDYAVESYKDYAKCGVRCISQSENTLTFACNKTPSISITVNVAVFS